MKRILAFMLAMVMLTGVFPASTAYATEVSVPEEITPAETLPEESVPEETVPEETVPEETVPEETVPEETVPEETVPEETVPEETVPEETVPEETVPEETVPEETVPENLFTDEPVNAVNGEDANYRYVISNNAVTITDYLGSDNVVTVPATIDGLPVTAIGGGAFEDCVQLTAITLPEGITSIGDSAFAYCYALESVQLPDSVTTMGNGAFQNCEALKQIRIPSNVTRIGMDTFFNCYQLETAILPAGLTYIGDYAFGACYKLTGLELPGSLTHIGDYAFRYCDAITRITLPAGLTVISEGAFSLCHNLQRIVIPGNVTTIEEEAFFQCSRLGSVTLPRSVTHVEKQAFGQCPALSCIPYAGIASQRDQITIDAGNDALKDANWHFDGAYCAVKLASVTPNAQGKPELNWTDLACMQRFDIYRATSSDGSYTLLGSTEGNSYVDENVQLGKKYYYRLVGINNEGEASPKSSAKSGYCCLAQPVITAKSPNRTPVISWEKVENATKYEVWRSESSHDTFKKIATTANLTYTDTKAPVGEASFYKVRALGSSSTMTGPYSNIASTGYVVSPPALKLSLTSAGLPSLSWNKVSGVTFYEVYRGLSPQGPFTCLVNQKAAAFVDSTAPADTECFYYVLAIAPGPDCSNRSQTLSVATACPTPTIRTAAADADTGLPVISWNSVEGAASYEISRSTQSSGSYTVIASVSGLTFTDETAAGGKTWYYKVTAVTPKGTRSNPSGAKSCKCVCAAPVLTLQADEATGKPQLTWETVSGAKKYEVYRATSEKGKYTKLTTTSRLTYTDTKATTARTYYYKVKAVASSSSYNSNYSQIRSCLCLCAQPKLTLKLNAATGKPELRWNKISGASRYEILRSTEEQGAYASLAVQTGTSYKDSTAVTDTHYFYKVRAIASNASASSSDSAPKSVAAACAQPVVTVATDNESGKPVLTWKAVADAAVYQVSRADKSDNYTAIASVSGLTFTDETAAGGKTWYYKVTALTAAGNPGADSSYQSGKCKCAAPVITAEVDVATGKPRISWETVSGAKKYEVYRATSERGKYTKLTTTSKLTYINTSASAGKTYYYKVKAIASSSSYNSGYSKILSCYALCAQPKVTAKLNTSTGTPELSWKKVSGAVKYEIFRAIGENGAYESLAVQTGTTYKDTAAQAGATCYYRVQALAAEPLCNSQPSAPVSVAVSCPAPVILTAESDPGTGQPKLTWNKVSGAATYEIYRATSSKGKYTLIHTTGEDTFLDADATPGKTYYYKLAALTASGIRSPLSGYKSAKCLMPAPVITSITLSDTGNPTVNWNPVPGASNYELYRSTKKDSGYTKVRTTMATSCFNIVPDVQTVYYYKVRAIMDNGGYSPYSAPRATYSISMTRASVSMQTGSLTTLTANYIGRYDLKWSSSNTDVAVVQNGRVCSRNIAGTAVITVTDGFCSASCTVTVKEPALRPLQILTPKNTIMYPGETLQLEYHYEGEGQLTWSCDFPDIFTVSDTGLVTAVGEGSTSVMVTDGTHRALLSIKVRNPAEKITGMNMNADHFLYEENVKMVGDYLYLMVETKPNPKMKDITYSTTDQGIVSVEWDSSQELGSDDRRTWLILRFNHPGTATVTITSEDRQISNSYTFHVKKEFECYPGKEKLTPEEFAYYATEVGVEMGHQRSQYHSGYLYMWVSEEHLTWERARMNGIAEAHRNFKFFNVDDGYTPPLLITYVGWNETQQKHLFHAGY